MVTSLRRCPEGTGVFSMVRLLFRLAVVFLLIGLFPLPVLLFGHGNLHKAIEAATLKIQASPQDAGLWLERSYLSRRHGDHDGAYRDLQKARELDQAAAEYNFLLGQLMVEARWHKSARQYLDAFLKKNPGHVEALVLRAKARQGGGDFAGSCKAYDAAIPLLKNPQPGHFLDQALVHSLNPETGPKVALERLEAAMKRIGRVVTLQEFALQYELQLEDYEAALSRIDELMEEAQRRERWLIRRGQVLLRAGRSGEARLAFGQVTSLVDALPPGVRERPVNQDLKRTAEAFLAELAD